MATSDRAVHIAIGADVAVAVAKFVAAAFTGSASMFAEGIHSLVDAGNGGLLLVGSRARRRAPDESHPFGYGKEQYFWTLVVAMLIFAMGGGFSIYEGASRLLHPRPIEHVGWNYAVLLVAFLCDGYAWLTAFRQLRATRKESNILRAAQASKDPSTFTVWFEDSAATVGVVIAFLGVLASRLLDSPYPDGIASLLIGLTMAGTALLLTYESRKLLIGESADPELIAGIVEIVGADEAVALCGPPLTMHLGPEDVLLNLDVQFRDGLSAESIIEAVDRLERIIRSRFQHVRRIFIEAERLRQDDGRPARSPRADAGEAAEGAETCPPRRAPADY